MNALAVIPARGGSRGIPRKNIQPLCGRPLIAWTIEAALGTRSIERVVVSTDDPQIEAVAVRCGAEVIARPAALAGDEASSESALLHALDALGERAELLVFLQCTSPLTTAADIDGTVQALLDRDADCAVAVARSHRFLWQVDGEGLAAGVNHDPRSPGGRERRQDRPAEFVEAGSVYVCRVEGFRRARSRFFGRIALHEIPAERCWEIDEPLDLEVAEVLLRRRLDREAIEQLPDPVAAIVFDFDGVMTDNRVLVSQDGGEAVWCDRSDGWGIGELKALGVPALVLSAERNTVVAARCAKLGLECVHGAVDKGVILQQWLVEKGIDAAHTVYVGNDVNDVPALAMVGCPIVVADAHPSARRHARIVLRARGGYGAVREVTDLVLRSAVERRSHQLCCTT
jgi:YrbI family 3-deoxy-D-manno-octulosonate 8-phosphate phosphatase